MPPMDWVTIANYDSPPIAHLALGALREQGIDATLRNDVIVANVWDAGAASQGVELRVPLIDRVRATEIVQDLRLDAEEQATLLPPEFTEEEPPPGPEDRQATVERAAERLFKTACVGVLIPLLHLYTLWVTIELLGRHPFRVWSRRARVHVALTVTLGLLTFVAYLAVFS